MARRSSKSFVKAHPLALALGGAAVLGSAYYLYRRHEAAKQVADVKANADPRMLAALGIAGIPAQGAQGAPWGIAGVPQIGYWPAPAFQG